MLIILKNKVYSFLYSILFLPLATLRILFKSYKNPEYLKRLGERFAIYSNNILFLKEYDLWIHTVSVGEFLAAKTLIDNVLEKNSKVKILITTTTPTGSRLVIGYIEKNNKYNLAHVYYPYDVRFICNKFLDKFRPKNAVFFETELWPRMYDSLRKRGIGLYLLNARISEKSFKGYLKIKSYISTVLNQINYIAAQTESDKSRLQQLGYKNIINVYGNIKYNFNLPGDLEEKSQIYKKIFGDKSKILICASTHKGEEEILIKIYKNLQLKYKDLIFVIAPRHPERFDEVYHLCLKNNLVVNRYSSLDTDNNKKSDVFLLDTMGKLLYFYKLATVAFVGGSLVDIGGHNPLEPARLLIPTIIGPYYTNFKQIVDDLADNNGIIKLNSNSELEEQVIKLLDRKSDREAIAMAAYNYMQSHQGIMQRYLELVNNCL